MKKLMLSVAVLTALVATYDANAYSYSVETNDTVVSVNIVNEGDQSFLHETFLAPDVTRVVYNMNSNVIYYRPDDTPTYTGGTHLASAQVRIQRGDVLGTGPILLGSGKEGTGLLVAENPNVVITNKIVFSNDSAWAMSANENSRLTVQRLAGGIGAHAARFGRSGNPSLLDLDLAEDDGNEPLNCIAFRGDVTGMIGGWLKATAQGKSPFLRNTQAGYSQAFNIAESGLVIDAAAGSDFLLATEVKVRNPEQTEAVEPLVVFPANADFEEGSTGGWSGKKVDSGAGDSVHGVMPNSDATWIRNRPTPFGDKQMVLRTGHRLTSPEITIPTNGNWRLNFWRTGRDSYSGSSMSTEIAFTNVETGETQTKTLAAMAQDINTYEQTLSPSFALAAGRYKFSIYPALKDKTAAMLYDNFRVEEADKNVYPTNGDFEANPGAGATPSGWTLENIDSPSGASLFGVYTNGHDYCKNRDTPYGKCALLLRTGHKATSPKFTIPSDGLWQISFWRVGRPSNSGVTADTDFTVTDASGVEQTVLLPGELDDIAAYRRVTLSFTLTAGEYSFSLHPHVMGNYACVLYDHFSVSKVFERRITGGATVTKQGAGRVIMPEQEYTNPFVVTDGTLAFRQSTLNDISAEATGTGCVELGSDLSISEGSAIDIGSGATLRLHDLGDNLVSNGSFEDNTIVSSSETWKEGGSQIANWSISCVTPNGNNKQGSNNGGVQKNGGTITPDGPLSPSGDCTAVVREHCKITQTVNVPEAGEYQLSFVYAMRKGYGNTDTRAQVLIGENVVVESLPKRTDSFMRVTTAVTLDAGAQVLTFHVNQGTSPDTGPMFLLDDVSLRKHGNLPALNGRIDLKSGATLQLDNVTPLILDVGAITVDGQPVQGRRNELRQAGVNVTGDGYIRLGDPLGMAIFIK